MVTFTNIAKSRSAGLINGLVTSPFTYIALGSGDTPESASDTSLEAEITSNGGSRTTAETIKQVTTFTTDDTALWEHTFYFSGPLTISEAGLFDAETGGNMYMRHVFSTPRNVTDGDSLTIGFASVQVAEG